MTNDFTTPPDPGHSGERIPLPNLRIHVCHANADLAETVREVSRDRLLSLVSFGYLPGGITAAIEHFRSAPTPNLIILELDSDRPAEAREQLERFADVCDPETKVVVAARTNDVEFYRWLKENGVSDYVLLPARPSAVIDVLYRIFGVKDGVEGRLVAVMAAKGGAGSSTLCHHLAAACARRTGVPTLLADLDLTFGTAALDFDLTPIRGSAEFLHAAGRAGSDPIEKFVLPAADNLFVLGSGASLVRTMPVTPDLVDAALRRFRSNYSHTFVDLPHVWSEWTKTALVHADRVVIVSGTDIASLRNVKSIFQILSDARPGDPAQLVLNMTGVRGRQELREQDFKAAAGREPDLVLRFAPEPFSSAAAEGRLIFDTHPRCPESRALLSYLEVLLPGPRQTSPLSGPLSRLLSRFRT